MLEFNRSLASIILGAFTLAAVATLSSPGLADDESAVVGEVQVESVAATAARAGETTRITFAIENQGPDPVTITGLRLPSGEPSRVVGFLGTSHSTALSGMRVAPGETLRLGPKSFWIEVGPLKSDLPPGTVLPGSLLLGRFEAPVGVHAIAGGMNDPGATTGSLPKVRTR